MLDMISIMFAWTHIFEGAPVRTFDWGATLFRRDDPVRSMYLVRTGSIALERPLADGTALTLHIAEEGHALAEASLFAATYHCDAIARSITQVAVVSRDCFLRAISDKPDVALSLIETYTKEVQAQRARMEILRLRRVADKLDAWLDIHGAPPKGTWVRVAEEIGVSHPALYRELATRTPKIKM